MRPRSLSDCPPPLCLFICVTKCQHRRHDLFFRTCSTALHFHAQARSLIIRFLNRRIVLLGYISDLFVVYYDKNATTMLICCCETRFISLAECRYSLLAIFCSHVKMFLCPSVLRCSLLRWGPGHRLPKSWLAPKFCRTLDTVVN